MDSGFGTFPKIRFPTMKFPRFKMAKNGHDNMSMSWSTKTCVDGHCKSQSSHENFKVNPIKK
eukprot:CAMPEP_0175890792 /NCGR_PEP_ID=MMETSP0107_2-20121207/48024_1 /TAXON_ID=195067 ORGANISM="Goniomonas pacifica, Strain CCMP1869" /NCGR_SAMPLE_ID=MMETSP0107_2 /ASSEMBLY_ACC=CAM_ASM_000203 /LENGTH=61 /DNA_ID=CAMNT_0017211595 /DNA_START=24 /DNA_END=209 /DNA_ORIENTATION=-